MKDFKILPISLKKFTLDTMVTYSSRVHGRWVGRASSWYNAGVVVVMRQAR